MPHVSDITAVAVTAERQTLHRQLLSPTPTISTADTVWLTADFTAGSDVRILNAGLQGADSPITEVIPSRSAAGQGAATNSEQARDRQILLPLAWLLGGRDELNDILQRPNLQVLYRRADAAKNRTVIKATYMTDSQLSEGALSDEEALGGVLLHSDFPWLLGQPTSKRIALGAWRSVTLPARSEGKMLYCFLIDKPAGASGKVSIELQDTRLTQYSPFRGVTWEWSWTYSAAQPAAADSIFFCPAPNIGEFAYTDSAASSSVDGSPVTGGGVLGDLPPYLLSWRSYTVRLRGASATLYVFPSYLAI